MIAGADATTIRTPGPDDPSLTNASYSYDLQVAATAPDGDPVLGEDKVSKFYPVSNALHGTVCGVDSGGGCTTLVSNASADLSDAHLGTIKTSVRTDNWQTSATAELIYYFTIIGPAAAFVPVTISGYGAADTNSNQFTRAEASIIADYYNKGISQDRWSQTFGAHEHGDFSATIDVKPNVGRPTRIDMKADVLAGSYFPYDYRIPDYFAGSASAEIDPLISIADPELADKYTILVSLSSAPVSPVPLPATSPLFGAAVGALGVIGFGGKRKKVAAVA